MLLRNSMEYAEWRRAVFVRDGFTCQMCSAYGRKLAAHHILTFAARRDLALVVGNGITLCWPCHRSIKGRESEYEQQFFEITSGLEARGVPYLILLSPEQAIETLSQFH